MPKQEKVLVIARNVLEQVGLFNGLEFDVDRFLDKMFARDSVFFMDRTRAEDDPQYKQIIPYVLIKSENSFLTYVRGKRAGESRLVGHRSVGIGGHINPVDDMPLLDTDYYNTYLTAVDREVCEEISIDTDYKNHTIALINDDSNPVGKVHLGIIHCFDLDQPAVTKREQMITQLEFMKPAQLRELKNEMESWSALCIDHIPRIRERLDSAPRPDLKH
jgi:predicted NUDIX family phosphoesterase